MAEVKWLDLIRNSEKTALLGSNLKKIHYKLPDGREMVEEYNLETGVLSKRAWKTNSTIYKTVKWQVEVGDPLSEKVDENIDQIGIKESQNSPFVVHRITKTKLEWRIRNLPYDLSVYQVSVDAKEKVIVVRTSNKKYFKKIPLLEYQRLDLIPKDDTLKFSHAHNTLIISLDKPAEYLAYEKKMQEELSNVKVIDNADIDCKQS
ncbi:protein DPCD [Planococcus citri]|uniref:protein DPCD n=1 Tax=Planococcus citri TaxID=170843 RepID=UPI0031FA0653